jgi:tRNA A-37 threonylcarbamoyl transferase component Bud32
VAPATDPHSLIGKVVAGSYVPSRIIGQGGMGWVLEANHVRLPKRFAIKLLDPEIAQDKLWLERFHREAVAASLLQNAHIVEVVDFNFLSTGEAFMVMEYLEGEDLATRIDKRGKLSPRYAASIIADVASGLAVAHAHGIVHRDIKPPNIFLAKRERDEELVKVLDFGAAKVRTPAAGALTLVGQTMGTPWYMSPEQAHGKELDARSDQWSLAVMLYQALTGGHLPFNAELPMEVLHKIVKDQGTRIQAFEPTLPAELQLVLDRAMAKQVDERFSSVEEFAARVSAVLDPGGHDRPSPKALTMRVDAVGAPMATPNAQQAVLPAAPPPPMAPAPGRVHPGMAALMAAAVVAAGLVGRWAMNPSPLPPTAPFATAPPPGAQPRTEAPRADQNQGMEAHPVAAPGIAAVALRGLDAGATAMAIDAPAAPEEGKPTAKGGAENVTRRPPKKRVANGLIESLQ